MPECDHKCDGCGENCSSRIEKIKPNEKTSIKKVIGIISGKGGVGKSYVTSLISSYLNKEGKKVGILDGDITGPSIPKSFGIKGGAEGDGIYIIPRITPSGIEIISSNLLLENEDDPIIWRGTLISSLLTQFFKDVAWGELDYLLIDMPPGTGDIALTSFQSLPLDGIIIVTTPQDLVSLIVKKAIHMAKTMSIPIIGLVENMSYLKCPDCNKIIYPFGESNIEDIAKKEDLKVLAKLPLNSENIKKVDEGRVEEVEEKEVLNILKYLGE